MKLHSTVFLVTILILEINAYQVSGSSPFDQLVKEYEVADGRHIHVFDAAIPEEHIMGLSTFMAANDNWRYVLHDPLVTGSDRIYDDKNGIPWKSWTDPTPLRATRIGSEMKNLVQAVNEKLNQGQTKNFQMNEVYAGIIRRGDKTMLHREGTDKNDSYCVAMFLNIVWRKNSYGELLFYDDEGEIVATVRPKFGRIVVWHSSITYIFRPPSIRQLASQVIVFAKFSANQRENIQKFNYFQNFVNELHNPPKLSNSLPEFTVQNNPSIDLEKHLTLYRKNRNDHFVAVFDDLFEEADLSAIRTWTIKYGTYFFDGSLDADSDNVQWIAGIGVPDFVKTPFWPMIFQIAKYVSNSTEWYPYDVACNLIKSYDHTRFHLDTSKENEKEMTFLLYLSPNWTATDYGETAFMETNNDDPGNEYIAEVVPMYGRVVIFDGNFPHSARPPSVTHHSARYTLAVKLGYTKIAAVQKTLQEEFKHEEGVVYYLNEIEKLHRSPKSAVAIRKYYAVVEHLSARVLQKQLYGAPVQEDGEEEVSYFYDSGSYHDDQIRNKKSSSDDRVPEVSESYEEIIEAQVSLPQQEGSMLKKMDKHYRLRDRLSVADEKDDASILESSLFSRTEREAVVNKWKRITSKEPDALLDYSELYLKQRNWIKDYISKKIIGLL